MGVENTLLWKKTLGKEEQRYKNELEFLKDEFCKFRKNVGFLASEIARILPEYTVHDITHIDALWEMADIFLPSNYALTPAEGFVLGGAFLLHDLGMALAAFPNGMEDIKQEQIWRDTVVSLSKRNGTKYDFENDAMIDDEIKKVATEKTLRMLHAQKAKELGVISWKDVNGNEIFLIESVELRHAYGEVIGRIARSHWLNCGELKKEFPVILGAVGSFPSEWEVDPLKLACILRIADAMHIDDRRAPIFLKAFRKLNNESELHWIFQEKLYKPRVERNRVVYTSKTAFSVDEMNAWWLCYDALKMIDQELKCVDSLLLEEHRPTYEIYGVYAIGNLEKIGQLIKVEGWEPVDAKIQVNNVAKLVSTMGGMQLYGKNCFIPLRELIQNAADAIRARRLLDDENESYGNIEIIVDKEHETYYVEIVDNGLGMSSKVLSKTLLDFGQSFWGTDDMHEEFPGLEQKSFYSTGKFGIGFFSVFMWGERVKVISNKYNQSRDNTMVLEFLQGLNARPILRKATEKEQIKNGGSRIRVYMFSSITEQYKRESFKNDLDFDEKISRLCFALDSNLFLTVNGKRKQLVKANDWKVMSNDKFYKRLLGKKCYTNIKKDYLDMAELLNHNLKLIKEDDGKIVGRACLCESRFVNLGIGCLKGLVVTDGLEATELLGIIGIVKGETFRVARDVAIPNISEKSLDSWVYEQTEGMIKIGYKDDKQVKLAGYIYALTQKKTNIKLARWKNEYVSYDDILNIVKRQDINEYYLVQDAAVAIYERENKTKIELADSVFVCDMGIPGILQTGMHSYIRWPEFKTKINGEVTTEVISKQIINAISEAWGIDGNKVETNASFSDDEKEFDAIIGTSEGKEVKMRVDILRRN